MNEIKQEDEIFCPECGKPVKRNAVICINCGVQIKELKIAFKQEDDIFCPECGKITKRNAPLCMNCGSQIKTISENIKIPIANEKEVNPDAKMKMAAVIMIILFGFFGWIYTYGRSAEKFWIAFTILVFLVLTSYYLSDFILLFTIGIWIWPLIDVSSKSSSFYENYPND